MNEILLIATDANSIQAWVSIAQLLITLGTVVLIISTFRLQAETFREQQKITQIEQMRFRLEIRPDIEITVNKHGLVFKPVGHDLVDAIFLVSDIAQGVEVPDSHDDATKFRTRFPKDVGVLIEMTIPEEYTYKAICTVTFYFSDDIGTRYSIYCQVWRGRPLLKMGPRLVDIESARLTTGI